MTRRRSWSMWLANSWTKSPMRVACRAIASSRQLVEWAGRADTGGQVRVKPGVEGSQDGRRWELSGALRDAGGPAGRTDTATRALGHRDHRAVRGDLRSGQLGGRGAVRPFQGGLAADLSG